MQQLSLLGEPEKITDKKDAIKEILAVRNKPDWPIVVSYGGGTNSSALVIALVAKGIKPDCIVFADTGNEHPATYAFMRRFDDWLESVGFPRITVVRYQIKSVKKRNRIIKPYLAIGTTALAWYVFEQVAKQTIKYGTLGDECLVLEALPAKAYGRSACSEKWKINPIRNYLKSKYENYIEMVGIHSDEQYRVLSNTGDLKCSIDYVFQDYPLIEWGYNQKTCEEICLKVLGEVPKKSSCWFCPNMRLSEVRELKAEYPELYELGCFMEEQSMPHVTSKNIKGLGRTFSWRDIDKLTPLEEAWIEQEKVSRKCSCTD